MPEKTVVRANDAFSDRAEVTDKQVVRVWTNLAPQQPVLSCIHEKLNKSSGGDAAITSYDRMHHRHNR